jgi:hypothetical protein
MLEKSVVLKHKDSICPEYEGVHGCTSHVCKKFGVKIYTEK